MEYTCPNCSKVSELKESSYKEAVRLKRLCRSCAMKKWQNKKYGEKIYTEYTSTCPKCNKLKQHSVKPSSLTQITTLKKRNSKRLCMSCFKLRILYIS